MAKFHTVMFLSWVLILRAAALPLSQYSPQPSQLAESQTGAPPLALRTSAADRSHLTPSSQNESLAVALPQRKNTQSNLRNKRSSKRRKRSQDTAEADSQFIGLLPRTLRHKDVITVEGVVSDNAQKFSIGLGTGQNFDENNIPFILHACFTNETTHLSTTLNGNIKIKNADHLLKPGDAFSLILAIKNEHLHITVGQRFLQSVELQHELSEIKTIHLTGHYKNVQRLEFKFA